LTFVPSFEDKTCLASHCITTMCRFSWHALGLTAVKEMQSCLVRCFLVLKVTSISCGHGHITTCIWFGRLQNPHQYKAPHHTPYILPMLPFLSLTWNKCKWTLVECVGQWLL